ncbi:MAG: 1,2-phenylacetyl-CoA epoxidase subunit PaaE [Terriglobales bacterium]
MSQYHRLEIAAVRPETREAVTVTLAIPEAERAAFRFLPGQHLNVRATIAGEEVRRSYSICSAPDDPGLRILIKRQPHGQFSTWANESLRPGQRLEVMPPTGLFHVPTEPVVAHRYLAIAAGSGITPVLSIIKSTLAAEPRSQFTLFYGNRGSGSTLFREELSDLKDRYLTRFVLLHVMSREHQDLDLLNGRLSGEKVRALLQHWGPLQGMRAAFICGPHDMNQDVAAALEAQGYPRAQIKLEQFATSQQRRRTVAVTAPAAAAELVKVTAILDGRHHEFTMARGRESILESGLRAGIDLRYSCQSGVCATCRAKLVQGEVDMDGNFALEDYEVARGFILTCQSYPRSERIVVDFDAD